MIEYIQGIANWSDLTPSEIREKFLETVTTEKPADQCYLSGEWVTKNLGLEITNSIYNAIKSISEPLAIKFSISGIDTRDPQWAAQVEVVAASVPSLAAYKDALKNFNITSKTRWESLGGTGEVPSVETIQESVTLIEKQSVISATRTAAAARHNNLKAWLDEYSVEGKTVEQVQAYCDDLLASADGNPAGGG